jgi:hypothetical protein
MSFDPNDSQIDAEWTKFMTKINKQNDCDNGDDLEYEESIEEEFDIANVEFASHRIAPITSVGGISTTGKGGTTNTGKALPHKRTCISKKQQRKTYSFIDIIDGNTDTSSIAPVTTVLSSDEHIVDNISSGNSIIENADDIAQSLLTSVPKSTPIYISTKTKIAYLNKKIDIYKVFWDIPVVHYYSRCEAVIKKQIKFQTTSPDDIVTIKEKLKQQKRYYEEQIIEHIDNPNGRIVFKDQRKVSIGICKKDLLNNNSKKKRAFFNCFVLILRINGGKCIDETVRSPNDDILFKEMHVKVFNTGKLEIPGIQDDRTLLQVLELLVSILRPVLGDDISYLKERCETVLINSNFNCGYFINRDKLFNLMKYKYRINSNYDSCSYPGIQCKFYYIPGDKIQTGQQPVNLENQNYYEISFMIFRTGSILIVGKCNESILMNIYRFIKNILETEFHVIQMGLVEQIKQNHILLSYPEFGLHEDESESSLIAINTPKKTSKARRKILMLGNIEPFHFNE